MADMHIARSLCVEAKTQSLLTSNAVVCKPRARSCPLGCSVPLCWNWTLEIEKLKLSLVRRIEIACNAISSNHHFFILPN